MYLYPYILVFHKKSQYDKRQNHMTPKETKRNTEMDIQMKQILVLAREDLNHH